MAIQAITTLLQRTAIMGKTKITLVLLNNQTKIIQVIRVIIRISIATTTKSAVI